MKMTHQFEINRWREKGREKRRYKMIKRTTTVTVVVPHLAKVNLNVLVWCIRLCCKFYRSKWFLSNGWEPVRQAHTKRSCGNGQPVLGRPSKKRKQQTCMDGKNSIFRLIFPSKSNSDRKREEEKNAKNTKYPFEHTVPSKKSAGKCYNFWVWHILDSVCVRIRVFDLNRSLFHRSCFASERTYLMF